MDNYKDNGQHRQWIDGEVRTAWFRLQKWLPKPLHGCGVTLTLRDGSEVVGHYMIVESGAVTPCCNPFGQWTASKGFPKDDDDTPVVGKAYQKDYNLRSMVINMGDHYQTDNIEQPVVVSFEGVVMTGQIRSMAGIRAARHQTDALYIEWLRNHCLTLGFSLDELAEFDHPRLVVYLRRGEVKHYSLDEFLNYNDAEVAFRKMQQSSL